MMVRRGTLRDIFVEGGRAAVMVGSEVVVLSELATSIVLSVPPSGGASVASIAAAMREEYGEPEPPYEAVTVVEEHVHDMVAHGILVIEQPLGTPPAKQSDVTDATRALREAMRVVLSPDPTSRWSPRVDSGAFAQAVRRQRVACQLATGLGRLDGNPELRSLVRREDAELRAACVPMIRHLHQVLGVLEAAGIRCLVFKGVALAAQAWGDEFARGYGDLDLLVPPADLARAFDVLMAAGCESTGRCPTPQQGWAWQHFTRVEHELTLTYDSTDIDLHWYVNLARSSFPDFDTLWARRDTVQVSGRRIATLSPYDSLAHSAGHSARDHWRWLRGIADVHQLMSHPEVWLSADRPLRRDQLLTVGVAARLLGIPVGSPQIVGEAVAMSADATATAVSRQSGIEHEPEAHRLPGANLSQALRASWRVQPHPSDHLRAVLRTVTPPAELAREASPSAAVGIPRVVLRRSRGWLRRSFNSLLCPGP